MKPKQSCIPSHYSRQPFLEWLNGSGVGQILHELEAAFLLNHLKLTYNQTILQVGSLGPINRFLRPDFRQNYVVVDISPPDGTPASAFAQADARDLPFANDSIDLIVMPHLLEFEQNPHAILMEIERVLKPEGELFIFGFNPWRIRSLPKGGPTEVVSIPNAVSSHRLNDWLSLLKLQPQLMAGFFPATSESIIRPTDFLGQSKAIFATAYAVRGTKRTFTLIPVKPAWLRAGSLLPRRTIDTAVVRRTP